jgi:hypothetical protein
LPVSSSARSRPWSGSCTGAFASCASNCMTTKIDEHVNGCHSPSRHRA